MVTVYTPPIFSTPGVGVQTGAIRSAACSSSKQAEVLAGQVIVTLSPERLMLRIGSDGMDCSSKAPRSVRTPGGPAGPGGA